MKVGGEAIMNDGTSIILFNIFWGIYKNSGALNMSVFGILLDCFKITIGGPLVGTVVGFLAYYWMSLATRRNNRDDVTIQLSITLFTAYLSYFIGDYVFGVSGVLSCCASALVLSKYVWPLLSSLETHTNVWQSIDYFGNTVLFFLAGVICHRAHSVNIAEVNHENSADDIDATIENVNLYTFEKLNLLYLAFFFILSALCRMCICYMFYPLLQLLGPSFDLKETSFIGWAGLHGAVGITLSLYVLQSLQDQTKGDIDVSIEGKQMLFMISGISVLSLFIQGITCRPLLQHLQVMSLSNIKMKILDYVYGRVRINGMNAFKFACIKEKCDPSDLNKYLSSLGSLKLNSFHDSIFTHHQTYNIDDLSSDGDKSNKSALNNHFKYFPIQHINTVESSRDDKGFHCSNTLDLNIQDNHMELPSIQPTTLSPPPAPSLYPPPDRSDFRTPIDREMSSQFSTVDTYEYEFDGLSPSNFMSDLEGNEVQDTEYNHFLHDSYDDETVNQYNSESFFHNIQEVDYTIDMLHARLKSFPLDDVDSYAKFDHEKTILRSTFYRLVRSGYWSMIRIGRLSRSSPATLLLLESVDYGLDRDDIELCDIDYIVNKLETSWKAKLTSCIDHLLEKIGKVSCFTKALEWLYMRNFAR